MQSNPGLMAIAVLEQHVIGNSTGRFISGVNSSLNIPFFTPCIIQINDDCNRPVQRIRSFTEKFWSKDSFGVIVGLRVIREKQVQAIALKFDQETGNIEGLQVLNESLYTILKNLKNQEEYNFLTLVQDVPLKFNLIAAKLLTEDTPGIMNGLRDPLQMTMIKVNQQDLAIEAIQKQIDKMIEDDYLSSRVKLSSSSIENQIMVKLSATLNKLETRLQKIEDVLEVMSCIILEL